jgi:hypothetical protein
MSSTQPPVRRIPAQYSVVHHSTNECSSDFGLAMDDEWARLVDSASGELSISVENRLEPCLAGGLCPEVRALAVSPLDELGIITQRLGNVPAPVSTSTRIPVAAVRRAVGIRPR